MSTADNSVQPQGSADEPNLGKRIRELRKSRGLTLIQLSEISGISRAALSKIEREDMSPTYATLRKIAAGFGLTVASLALKGESIAPLEIVRADQRRAYDTPQYGYETLAGNSDQTNIKFFISELLAADLDEFPEHHVHQSQDFLYVLDGCLDASFEGQERFSLNAGDSLSFDGRIPHAFASSHREGAGNARILWVSRTLI